MVKVNKRRAAEGSAFQFEPETSIMSLAVGMGSKSVGCRGVHAVRCDTPVSDKSWLWLWRGKVQERRGGDARGREAGEGRRP